MPHQLCSGKGEAWFGIAASPLLASRGSIANYVKLYQDLGPVEANAGVPNLSSVRALSLC
jgi:hypothetical protein